MKIRRVLGPDRERIGVDSIFVSHVYLQQHAVVVYLRIDAKYRIMRFVFSLSIINILNQRRCLAAAL